MHVNTHTFEGTSEYKVVPMHTAVEAAVPVLGRAFSEGMTARKDPDRENFYSVEIDGVSYYFHVFQERRTAYLISAELKNLGFAPAEEQASAAACHGC